MRINTTRVDLEELEITKTEKLLAVVLTMFLLVGGLWMYSKIDDIGRSTYQSPATYYTPSERAAVARADLARRRLGAAETAVSVTRRDLELARETYRTALDAGRKAPVLEEAYRARQLDYAAAQRTEQAAELAVASTQSAADDAEHRAGAEALASARQSELVTFGIRLAAVLAILAFGYWLLIRLRRSSSHYLSVAFAVVAFAALMAFIMAGDYLSDYIDVGELGPVVLSLVGIAMTLATFWWLQRYLARRVPPRRVRKGECPFCGYPARGGQHCEGCGRAVIGDCTTCHEPRRVGTFHCGTCGAS